MLRLRKGGAQGAGGGAQGAGGGPKEQEEGLKGQEKVHKGPLTLNDVLLEGLVAIFAHIDKSIQSLVVDKLQNQVLIILWVESVWDVSGDVCKVGMGGGRCHTLVKKGWGRVVRGTLKYQQHMIPGPMYSVQYILVQRCTVCVYCMCAYECMCVHECMCA